MKSKFLFYSFLFVSILLHNSCSTVPLTGRQQLSLVPNSTMLATSFTQYDEFLKTNKTIVNSQEAKTVTNIGHKIQKAVELYFAENNLQKRAVKIGRRNNLMTEIISGLKENDQVVSYLSNDLKEGITVEIRR